MAKRKNFDLAASTRRSWKAELKRDWVVYLLFVPIIVYEIVLHYLPMFGIIIAFQDYKPFKGILGSKWVGLYQFQKLFGSFKFFELLGKTKDSGNIELHGEGKWFIMITCRKSEKALLMIFIRHRHGNGAPGDTGGRSAVCVNDAGNAG